MHLVEFRNGPVNHGQIVMRVGHHSYERLVHLSEILFEAENKLCAIVYLGSRVVF